MSKSQRFRNNLYCTSVEKALPRLVDITELFFRELGEVHGICQTWYLRHPEVKLPTDLPWQNVRLTWAPRRHGGFFGKLLNLAAYLVCDVVEMNRALRDGASIVLVRDKYVACIAAFLLTRYYSAKFVIWCSYPLPEHDEEIAAMSAGIKRWLLKIRSKSGELIYYRWGMRQADFVFVQSARMKRDLLAYGVPEARMQPVPMGVSRRVLDNAANQGDVEIVSGRVLYLGTLIRVRRLTMLVRAFALVAERVGHAQLWFVGEGIEPGDRQALVDEVVRLGLEERVVFTGQLPMDKAWDHVRSAEVCLSPFYPTKVLSSTSPTKLVEYLAFGKPVVANDHPEQAQVLSESGAGLCVPWDETAFAEAIVNLLLNPALAKSMGAKGPSWVRSHRTYDLISRPVLDRLASLSRTFQREGIDDARG